MPGDFGAFITKYPRIVLIRLFSADMKFKLFSIRDILRASSIKMSSDLTSWERGQLKELERTGRKGYFKNGKLQVLSERESNNSRNGRSYLKASRTLEATPMDSHDNTMAGNPGANK